MVRFDGREITKHLAFALIMGVVGAFVSIVLSLLVDSAYHLSMECRWLLFALPVLGVLGLFVYRWFKLAVDTDTFSVLEDIRRDVPISPWLSPGILIGTFLTVLGGGAVGKEAAALQMGASVGTLVGRPFKLRPINPKRWGNTMDGYVAATGMAAVFSALFFTPIGSTMLVLEFLHFRGEATKHWPTILLAAFVAFGIANIFRIGDVIPQVDLPPITWAVVALCIVIGVISSFFGIIFTRLHDALKRLTARFAHPELPLVAGGILFIIFICCFDLGSFEGPGMNLLRASLEGDIQPYDFLIKLGLVALVLGVGFKGGEIMPTFTIGALLGAGCGILTGAGGGWTAAVGISAYFATVCCCPLAAFLMGIEIFGLGAAPLLAVGGATAYLFSRGDGVYGAGINLSRHAISRRYRRWQNSRGDARRPASKFVTRLSHLATTVVEIIAPMQDKNAKDDEEQTPAVKAASAPPPTDGPPSSAADKLPSSADQSAGRASKSRDGR